MGKISGTFIDFSELTHKDEDLLNWDVDGWKSEFRDMKNAGINLVIPARTMKFGRTYYFSDIYETHKEKDYLSPFMEASREVGMDVYISGFLSDYFFTADDENFKRMMKRDITINVNVISEILDKYKNYDNIKGIYISHEADNENLRSEIRKAAARGFFGTLYSSLRAVSDLPILSSPFFTKTSTPDELAVFWDDFLDRKMFDIIAMQDGIGCNRDITPEDISAYYSKLKPIFDKHSIVFWNNIETFSFNPGYRESGFDRSKIWLKTAPISRIDKQYDAGKAYTEKSITWEYGHFFSRRQAGEDFYECFREWNI